MSEFVSRQPHIFTLGEAAKAAGVSKPTLSKAIKAGRLSAEHKPDGTYSIQPAELFRVYPPKAQANRQANPHFGVVATAEGNGLHEREVDGLRFQLATLTEERERERRQFQEQVDDLRRRLDQEGEERRKLTAILTDERSKAGGAVPAPSAPTSAQQGGSGLFGWLRRWG